MAGGLGAVKDRVTGTLRRQRERRPWLDHLVRAYTRYKSTNGDHLAAAVTYFSFLALFPLVLLAMSVAGYVLANQQSLLTALKDAIADNVPGSVGEQVSQIVDTAVQRRGTIGLVGLLGVAYAGLGWIGNLRTALQVVWSCEKVEENAVKAKLGDLLVLLGLGLGVVVSIALTTGGTAVTNQLVEAVGLDGVPGMGTLVRVLGLALAVAADTLIFAWLFVRLPRRPVRYRSVLRGAVFAAVGYEILKVLGAVFISQVGSNGAYGTFAGIVGLLIWIDLVSRFLLFAAAWTATGQQPPAPDADRPEPGRSASAGDRAAEGREPAGARSGPSLPSADGANGRSPAGAGARRDGAPSPTAVAGVLVGAGAALGATAATAGRRLLRRRADGDR